jgi:hypothetical protein
MKRYRWLTLGPFFCEAVFIAGLEMPLQSGAKDLKRFRWLAYTALHCEAVFVAGLEMPLKTAARKL